LDEAPLIALRVVQYLEHASRALPGSADALRPKVFGVIGSLPKVADGYVYVQSVLDSFGFRDSLEGKLCPARRGDVAPVRVTHLHLAAQYSGPKAS
jgi:hypothetical protein